jgi:inosine/xanthosine triphosphatase
VKKVIVGSGNPTKVNSTKAAFEAIWPDETFEVTGVEVASGVSDQPMSEEETIRGTKNRARAAMLKSKADYAVGLEGGLWKINGDWFESGWIAVLDADGNFGLGSTPVIEMPPRLLKEIETGKELGVVIDEITGEQGLSKRGGFFGLMTNGTLDRTAALEDGVKFALGRFVRPEFYETEAAAVKR